jgi:hypothetical protein
MRFTELNNEQRRQLIDVVGTFAAWRDASRKATRGSLRWVTRKGSDYLEAGSAAPMTTGTATQIPDHRRGALAS